MDINAKLKISVESNIAKSCRRIFFNHLYDTDYENGFHVDIMYGSGSGTLVFYDGKFFLLTAKHVIDKNTVGGYQNNSPFWVPVYKNLNLKSLHDFLLPKYYYDIGSLISVNNYLIDSNDICLVELFDPMPLHTPDYFIDLTDDRFVLKKNDYYEGQFLIANGYPFGLNNFDHEFKSEGFTHSTNVVRHSAVGICLMEKDTPYISYEITNMSDVNHDGMSGGVVCNAWDTPEKVQWAGLMLSGNKKITRFLPAWCVYEALTNYKKSKKHIIDPAADVTSDLEKIKEVFMEYANEFSQNKRR
ncbi:hypothetical protein MNBD_GAMMA12-2633 [hydrothermal vent metagenome]|uniref:Serine protease n=1 Tax=hydrothermal vent metagenome TaxID=652676 RepID=A0A3B0YUN5_9ZZZZ